MEIGTAGEGVETPDHQEIQIIDKDESPASIKEVDGRMKLAISALIRSTITPDPELRCGSSKSLARISGVQPLTVLSEWLVVLSAEREKLVKSQTGKKKWVEGTSGEKSSGPECLVSCLEPVLEEITRSSSLNSGDVRHRAALGQVISALVRISSHQFISCE